MFTLHVQELLGHEAHSFYVDINVGARGGLEVSQVSKSVECWPQTDLLQLWHI